MLGFDVNKHVRRGVASNPTTSSIVLETLARDAEEVVRAGVACNPMTPPALLARVLSLARHDEVRILAAAASNHSLPPDEIASLASDDRPLIRMAAASNPALPVEQMTELVCDEDKHVRQALIYNPAMPVSLLLKLPSDEDLRWALSDHPALPAQVLLELAGDEDASCTRTPANVFLKLACDEDIHVRSALIKNRTLTAMVRGKLPCCAQAISARFEDKSVRKALITHPDIPSQLLLMLALTDKDADVRETAMSIAKTKPNTFWETTMSPGDMLLRVSSSGSGAMRRLDEALLTGMFLLSQSVAQSLAVARNVIERVQHLLKSNNHQNSNSIE
ncbi:TPA: hypothetical protein SIA29_004191 [Aeromonas sobria]|nr:hypothetical protein [Aeromonas sobria]HEH9433273.1 hypothetical protein [Aeromonas sobria]